MKHAVTVPSLGLVESLTVTSWSRAAGDLVAKGDVVATIETEKSAVDIESPATGRLEIAIAASPDLVPAEAILGYVDDGVA